MLLLILILILSQGLYNIHTVRILSELEIISLLANMQGPLSHSYESGK